MGTVTLKVKLCNAQRNETCTISFELTESLYVGERDLISFIKSGFTPESAEIMKVTDSVEETLFTTVLTDKK